MFRGGEELARLLLPLVACGAVFEGEDFAEGVEVFLGPFGDLAEGADAVGAQFVAQHFFDAFDASEVVFRAGWELRSLLQRFLQHALAGFDGGSGALGFIEAFLAAFEAAAGEREAGGIARGLRFERGDAALP